MKRIFSILFALVLVVSLVLALAVPAAAAYKEGGGTYWYYVDASYGGYHNSVPLVIKLDGNPSAGQIFYVGDTITITCYLHAVAQSCGGDGNGAWTDWDLEITGLSGTNSTTGWNYDHSSGCAVADEDTTLSITYSLTAPGTHIVNMNSYAAVSQYWTDVAEDSANASLTFEVVLPPMVLKTEAAAELEAITGLNEEGQEKLGEALEYLRESVFGEPGDEEVLWLDESHLSPDNGDDVFSTENDAVEKLMEILEKPGEFGASPSVVAEIVHVIEDKILEADRLLAQTAIDEAQSGDPELLAEANEELAKAASAKANAEYDKAVENYFKAWEAALKSIGAI